MSQVSKGRYVPSVILSCWGIRNDSLEVSDMSLEGWQESDKARWAEEIINYRNSFKESKDKRAGIRAHRRNGKWFS